MNTSQKTITVNGKALTASAIRKSPQDIAQGGHYIASTKAGEIHWIDRRDKIAILNAGSVRRDFPFGSVIAVLNH